ncbi:MAG: glutamate synthase [Sphaerochaetaceae bacterium]
METIQVGLTHFQLLNQRIRDLEEQVIQLDDVNGQRYIGCGLKNKTITINGVPGNALGAFLDGSTIIVNNNAQDATGDTMNDGTIIIHGSCGDAVGYAMRGGRIFIRDSAGYRSGIHMKAYREKQPVLIIGDRAGSFFGEYQAGGTIIVLGLKQNGKPPVGFFCGTGMHGGRMFIRADTLPPDLPAQVVATSAGKEDLAGISSEIAAFCQVFSLDMDEIMSHHFFKLVPNSSTPYRQLYTYV